MSRRIISLVLSFGLLFQQISFAQVATELNLTNYLSKIGSNILQDKFRPPHLRYFSYDGLNDNFKVLLDQGDLKNLKKPELENSTKTLLSYFLVGVTLPDSMFWVNLRPDSEDQIIDQYLEKTDVGKIMLESDLQLKKDTAQMTSPATPEGKEYWDKLYKKAAELYGYDNVTIPTLTRPWIVPGEIIVRESKDSAYVYKATLKVMLEQDYLKDSATYSFKDERSKALNEYSSQLIRELIIPKLTKEVNSSKRYAALRQVYYSLILSRWFKLRFTGKAGSYASLINTKDLTNLISQEAWSKTDYFKQYQKSFADGEYNIKEPVYTPTGQVIRSYFSGGINVASSAINTQNGIILSNDNASKLGDVIGGKAIVDPRNISLEPTVAASPIQNNVDIERYRNKLQPILRDKNGGIFAKIQALDNEGELSKIFPVMEVLKTKIKDRQANVSVFEHTLGLIKELSLIEDDSFSAFTAVIGKTEAGQLKVDEKLFNEYRNMFKEIVQDKEGRELIYLITLLHDVGEAEKTQGHPLISATMIQPWLQGILSQEQIDKVEAVIRSHVDLGTLYFAERTPGYIESNPASLGVGLDRNKYQDYIKLLSILTLLDAGVSITKTRAEFYARIGKGSGVQEDFYERRLDQFCSYRDKETQDDVLDKNKRLGAVKEQEKLQRIIGKAEYERFKEALRSDIEVFDYGIFFLRGLKDGASLVKLFFIVNKLTEEQNIKRVNFTAPSGIAGNVAVEIEKNILENWDLKDITKLSPEDLKKELERKGIAVRYKDGQLFIYNWEYYNASLKLKELRQNSGLPVAVEPLNVPVEPSKNLFWSGLFRALRFDSPVYRRVEREAKTEERYTGQPVFANANEGVDTDIKELKVYDVSKPEFYSIRKGEDVRGFILDSKTDIPPEAYFMHRGVFASREDIQKAFYDNKIRFDITVIPPAIWGVDFAKTVGHYHDPVEMPEIYQVVSGEVLWLMQKSDEKGNVIDFITVKAKAGDIAIMLPGYGHVSVNLSETEPLIMANWLTWHQSSYYGSFKDKKGAAYYVIRNNQGQPELIPNQEYLKTQGTLPQPRQMVSKDSIPVFGLTRRIPIYSLVRFNDKKFKQKVRFLNYPDEFMNFLTPEVTLDDAGQKEEIKISTSPIGTNEEKLRDGGSLRSLVANLPVSVEEKTIYVSGSRDELHEYETRASFTLGVAQLEEVVQILSQNPNLVPLGISISREKEIDYDGPNYQREEIVLRVKEGQEHKFLDISGRNSRYDSWEGAYALWDEAKDGKSSSSINTQTYKKPGGIDFRALSMTIQPMGSFSGLNFKLPQLSQAELGRINVGAEMQQIKSMVQAGITPSGWRVKELIAACIQKKEMNSQVDSLLFCLVDIFKLEEENASESSPELKEALVIVDSRS